jgi:GrpB-like predicted nucleotidyltransferase (UPF0157 family)
MVERADNGGVLTTKADLDAVTIGGARPHGGPVHLAEYDPVWPVLFAKEAARIAHMLGETAMCIEHVGSTSVPELAAKPIIDIVLAVVDSSDESSYVVSLERDGYELRIREPDWFEHRVLKSRDTDINLHVFTQGCPEVDRMIRFRDHLRWNAEDRKRYEVAKRELAKRDWEFIQNYADAKTEVIEQIMARAGERGN